MFNAEIGDRFEDLDPRQGNRVVRVVGVKETARRGRRYQLEVEVAERNPKTVGRHRWVGVMTLAHKYDKISR